jgi:uncharacterized lipoprotein YddW (UPF0748 family)
MTTLVLTLCLAMNAGVNEQPVDSFQYASSKVAQAVWVASTGTPLPVMVKDGNRKVLEFGVPFDKQARIERTSLDRKVDLDLSVPGEFAMEIAADDLAAIGHLSLYFRSGDGWYSAGAGLNQKGWQTLHFSKASFGVEGNPAGWQKIDGIRISIWRGQPKGATVRLRRLAAEWHDVALVIPAAHGQKSHPEFSASLQTAALVGELLSELGLGADAVEDLAVPSGALGNRRVAILAYNPQVSNEVVEALVRFVEKGGRLLVCYGLPPRLARELGFGPGRYVRPEREGGLAEIRFEANDVAGLPAMVHQASWNITTAEPLGHHARVIGRWYDDQGRSAGLPAMLLSDRGAYLSHILLPGDRAAKSQLLAAILGHLAPPLWRTMAQSELDRASQIGHLHDMGELQAYVKAAGNPKAAECLRAALTTFDGARTLLSRENYPVSVGEARKSRAILAEAYLRSASSPVREGRAFWNHSGTGAYPGDWDRTARELADCGFNMIVPNMLWAGTAHYASDVLPRSATFEKYGDQIAQCAAAAKKYGLEVHVWKVNHNLSNAPKDFIARLRAEHRTQVSDKGRPCDWLCPSHPKNFKLELESMLEVVRKYDVDGIHFDYIRYPDADHCCCDGCRERFEAESGLRVARWPDDCQRGALRDRFLDWRCAQITRLVEAVHREAKKIKPTVKISAAVFSNYPNCRESVGQDWVAWVKAGYLDFVCPMDYTQSDAELRNMVAGQLKLVQGRVPLYAGIGAWQLGTPDRVVGQILAARSAGAAGFTVFNLDASAAQEILPAIKIGAGAHQAVPPHRQP